MTSRISGRRAGVTAAITLAPLAAWRFAHAYRSRAGYPRRHPPANDPSILGLPFETRTIATESGVDLPAWWIPTRSGERGPAVVLVHGWESARDRTLPNAHFLHESGFHILTIDVRGHGDNPAELLPLTAGEFGADALAAVRHLLDRPEVTSVGVLGHSMGATGVLLAAAAEPRVGAVVAVASPADPYRLTRQTFHLASLPLPDVIAYPLAWITTHVFLEPRGHTVRSVSASQAIATYRGPVLLIQGTEDRVVPVSHLRRLAAAVRRSRAAGPDPAPIEVLEIDGGHHSWLYEYPEYRTVVARFLATALGGVDPKTAAGIAAGVDAVRIPDAITGFSAMENEPGGLRTLVRAMREA